MNKKLIATISLAASIPVLLFATVDIGGDNTVGGAGNYIYDVEWLTVTTSADIYQLYAGLINAVDAEFTNLNVGDISSNDLFAGGASSIGTNNLVSASNTLAIGLGLETFVNPNSLMIGEYNEDKAGLRFSVGDGTSAERSNSFEIWQDGKVFIKEPQGDIPMGDYTN